MNTCNSNSKRIQVKEKPTVAHVTQTEHLLLKQKMCNSNITHVAKTEDV